MISSFLDLQWIRDWPIRQKLMLVIMLTCAAVLLIDCGLLGFYQIYRFRESLVRNSTVLADVLAKNTQAALSFQDENAAQQTLQAVQEDSYVTAACLYNEKNVRFATYVREGKKTVFPDQPGPDGSRFESNSLAVFRPVMLNGRQIGTIYLKSSLQGLYERLYLFAGFSFFVLIISALAAYAFSSRLQRAILQPIHALTQTARSISVDKDFRVRASPQGRDEVGQLTEALNQLLTSIEERDKALQTTNDLLRGEIAERKAAEGALAASEQRLQALVEQRTAKLTETIGELEAFSYSIAHDMRAPLRSLQGFSDILLTEYADKLDDEGQQFLNRIAKSAARMDKLIQDVLNYSRVVRSDFPLGPVDVAQLLEGILDSYPMFAAAKAEISIQGPFPLVVGNEAMLTQVFSNLIGNAVKFVAPGVRPHLKIWAEPSAQSVRIYVEDNGIGIEPDHFERIFAMFQQVSKNFEGTGIGLAIVKKAMDRMGGKVGVQSKLDQGSIFWIEMKRADNPTH